MKKNIDDSYKFIPTTSKTDKQRLFTYFKRLTLQKSFIEKVKAIQTEYGPDYIALNSDNSDSEYTKAVDNLIWEYRLDPIEWAQTFHTYIKTGKIVEPGGRAASCYIINFKKELSSKENYHFLKVLAQTYPVAILIHPDLSGRQIKKFIDETYIQSIKKVQSEYTNPASLVGKTRNSFTYKRNKIILENKNKSIKKIREILKKKGYETDIDSIKMAKNKMERS